MEQAIIKYKDAYRNQIINIWEQSVCATHHFLLEKDIDFYKSKVEGIDFNSLAVYCYMTKSKEIIGFLGVLDSKLEMLFLSPNHIGKGIGRILVEYAIKELGVTKVDVNEENIKAVSFYKKHGFKVFDRESTDDYGKPYPVLEMHL